MQSPKNKIKNKLMAVPIIYPHIVYKYRGWVDDNHKNVLKKNELYLSSPKEFNDPFDCRIPTNLYMLDTNEKIKKYVDAVTIRQFQPLQDMQQNVKTRMDDLTNRLTQNIEEAQAWNEEFTFNSQDNHYGVLSLSEIWDNPIMWAHYSYKHSGYCVGFWEQKLRLSGCFGHGGLVNYSHFFPQINPLDNDGTSEYALEMGIVETHTKAMSWEYEKEYRLFKLFFETDKPPADEKRKVYIPDSFFTEIILGVQCSKETKEEIIEIAKRKNIPVFKAKKVPFQFKLDRERIA